MSFAFSYLGRSGLEGSTLNLAPNLAREPVAFDAALKRPQRFREAISALHDVVISDHRFKRRDKTAYEAWKAGEAARVRGVRADAVKQAQADIAAKRGEPLPAGFEREFNRHCKTYWGARGASAFRGLGARHDRLRGDGKSGARAGAVGGVRAEKAIRATGGGGTRPIALRRRSGRFQESGESDRCRCPGRRGRRRRRDRG